MTQGKWMIVSNSNTVRRLLRLHCWSFIANGYAKTHIGRAMKYFHQSYLNYEAGLVCDHIDRYKFNNRFENLRIVTYQQNNRNHSKRSDNTSGYTGICETIMSGKPYVKVCIFTDVNKPITKYFRIDKLGREEALRLAIAQRQEWTQQFGYDHQ